MATNVVHSIYKLMFLLFLSDGTVTTINSTSTQDVADVATELREA